MRSYVHLPVVPKNKTVKEVVAHINDWLAKHII